MSEKNYSKRFIVFTYMFMSFCWAGKNGCTVKEMVADAFAGAVRGIVMVLLDDMMPTYFSRYLAAMAGGMFLILVGRFLYNFPSGPLVINNMILPMAAGAMLIDGVFRGSETSGRKKIATALVISACLARGILTAELFGAVLY